LKILIVIKGVIMKKLEDGLLATLIPLVNPNLHLGLSKTAYFPKFNRFKLTEKNFPCHFVYDFNCYRLGLVTNDNCFIQDSGWLFSRMKDEITKLYISLEKSYVIKDEGTREKGTKFMLKAFKED
jgi:hypothetical protein